MGQQPVGLSTRSFAGGVKMSHDMRYVATDAAIAESMAEGWGDHYAASDGEDLTTCVICGGTIDPDRKRNAMDPHADGLDAQRLTGHRGGM